MPVIVGDISYNFGLTPGGITRHVNDNSVLYTFTTWTFTSCGQYGRIGPTLAQMQTAYTGTTWAQNTSYLTIVGSGIQKWTVPKTGQYRIQVAGAPGGRGTDFSTGTQGNPGAGIIISANFYLSVNDIVYILVGQKAPDFTTASQYGYGATDTDAGGGGGTFVARKVKDSTSSSYYLTVDSAYVQPLIVAGGGGGGSSDGNGMNATFSSWQDPTNHNVGDVPYASCGGGFSRRQGDWYVSGIDSVYNSTVSGSGAGYPAGTGVTSIPNRWGATFVNGGVGGIQSAGYSGATDPGCGGFGGGAGSTDESGAGGGGWVGGVNGDNTTTGSQGGTSYFDISATNVSNDGFNAYASATTPNGYCSITYYGQ